jgi:hypothetical protein
MGIFIELFLLNLYVMELASETGRHPTASSLHQAISQKLITAGNTSCCRLFLFAAVLSLGVSCWKPIRAYPGMGIFSQVDPYTSYTLLLLSAFL